MPHGVRVGRLCEASPGGMIDVREQELDVSDELHGVTHRVAIWLEAQVKKTGL